MLPNLYLDSRSPTLWAAVPNALSNATNADDLFSALGLGCSGQGTRDGSPKRLG